jgi:hypothetical protein
MMSDYYMQFSTAIEVTDEEKAWLEEYLGPCPNDVLDGKGDTKAINRWLDTKGARKTYDETDEEPEFWPHFEYRLRDNVWWLYSEENSNLDFVELAVRMFLKKWRPDQCVTIDAAHLCSKLLADAFGGTAMFITAEDTTYCHTGQWLEAQVEAFNNRRKENA